eukprot:722512-Pyramimonas_sp.AAC.1
MTGASQCTAYGVIAAPTVLCSQEGGFGLRSTFMSARTLRHTPALWLPQTATQLTRLKLGSGIAPATSLRLPHGKSPRGLLHGGLGQLVGSQAVCQGACCAGPCRQKCQQRSGPTAWVAQCPTLGPDGCASWTARPTAASKKKKLMVH